VRIADARISVIQVQNDSTAQQVGLLPGDLLISVNGIIARDEEQVTGAIYDNLSADTNIEIKVLRDGILRDLLYRPDLGPLTGLVFRSNPDLKQSISPGQSLLKGASRIWEVLVLSRNEVSRWIAGSSSIEVVGPIGIAQATGQVATGGLNPILVWIALLSVNLALINLLPIPALDGGRIALVLLELIRGGRRLSANRERQLHLLGFGLLMVLVIFVSVSDLRRLVTSATMFGS
jgi:regulator of sigma E protease